MQILFSDLGGGEVETNGFSRMLDEPVGEEVTEVTIKMEGSFARILIRLSYL